MTNIFYQTLFKITACLLLTFKIQLAYASMDNENIINNLFETQGKDNVAQFISQKRDGSITIEKNHTFINARGRPNLAFITAKSILHDLKILKMEISTLESELNIFLENKSTKKKEEDKRLNRIIDDKKDIVLNNKLRKLNIVINNKLRKLKEELKAAKSAYHNSSSNSERTQLMKDIGKLRSAYRKTNKELKSLENLINHDLNEWEIIL